MNLLINITREDIDEGRCADARRCAIANAVNRAVSPLVAEEGWTVFFDGYNVCLTPNGEAAVRGVTRVRLPDDEELMEFARDYDLTAHDYKPREAKAAIPERSFVVPIEDCHAKYFLPEFIVE